MGRMYTATLCVLASAVLCLAEDGQPLLLRKPTVSRTQIVFSYAGDLWVVGREGGESRRLTTAPGEETDPAFSPDSSRLAYVPTVQWQRAWKRYRGGQTKPIWIANLSDSDIEAKIPHDNSNDFNPMWVGDTIYFLSDRNGPVTLFAYDTKTRSV